MKTIFDELEAEVNQNAVNRKNNREVHQDYLKHLKKSVETLREIVKEAKVERLLDRSLASAYLYTKHSQELLEKHSCYVRGTNGVELFKDTMADMNIPANDASAEQAHAVAPLTRTDDKILLSSKWVPIGKSNCILDVQKSQRNPIFPIAMAILKNTNFFRAFTASSTILAIYIQEDALDITPTNDKNPYVSPPSSDIVIKYVNTLRYPSIIRNVSALSFNALYQPWRAILSMINMWLTSKTARYDRPRHHVLQILWGIIYHSNIDYAERIWEEFVQSIQTFLTDSKNLTTASHGKKKTTHLLIRSDGREIFGKLIPDALLSDESKEHPTMRCTPMPTEAFRHAESSSLDAKLALTESEIESDNVVPKINTEDQDKGQAGPNPEPASSTGTLSSLQNLEKELSFTDHFFVKKQQEEEPRKTNVEVEVQSMVSVPIHQDTSSVPLMTTLVIDLMTSQYGSLLPTSAGTTLAHMTNLLQYNLALEERLDKHGSWLYKLENLNIPHQVSKAVDEIITDAVDWAMQAPLEARLSDLPTIDIKEILQQRMFKDKSYESHEDHKNLYDALEKSLERAFGAPCTSRASGSSQLPPPPPPLSTSTSGSTQQQGSKVLTGVSRTQELSPTDSLIQDDSIPDERVHLFDDEHSENDHLPKADSRKDWWKPLPKEERPATPETAWTIPSSNAYEVVKAFYPDVIHLEFQMEECHKMLTNQVDWMNLEGDQVRVNVKRPLPLGGPSGHVTIQT
nr:hypothetical protein [Tanacetum cinerariifolium]